MSSTQQINTLSEFLLQAQTQYLVLDLGRGIRHIDNQVFFEWENQQSPCLYPRLDHAWFCIAFWNQQLSSEHYIWYLKLPLDEAGLLVQAARNQFLEIVVQALGKDLLSNKDENAQLPDNPFVFTPSQQQMADCNTHIRKHLALGSKSDSQWGKTVASYMYAPSMHPEQDIWQQFSVQDVSDFVIYPHSNPDDIRASEQHQQNIANNLSLYQQALLTCLLASLESIVVFEPLSKGLIELSESTNDEQVRSLCLRAVSFDANNINDSHIIEIIENDAMFSLETSVVIAGRYYRIFAEVELLQKFMHKVALLDPKHELFKALYSDLVKIPSCRAHMLAFVRDQARSSEVEQALGKLFSH